MVEQYFAPKKTNLKLVEPTYTLTISLKMKKSFNLNQVGVSDFCSNAATTNLQASNISEKVMHFSLESMSSFSTSSSVLFH